MRLTAPLALGVLFNPVSTAGDRLYFAGKTSKYNGDTAAYFPLFDPGDPAYFDNTYLNTGWLNGYNPSDAFVGSLCTDELVGVCEERTPMMDALHVWIDETWILNLVGISEGKHSVEVYDAAGQVVLRTLTRSIGPRTPVRIVLPPLAGGVYLVHAEGRSSASRFTVIR